MAWRLTPITPTGHTGEMAGTELGRTFLETNQGLRLAYSKVV